MKLAYYRRATIGLLSTRVVFIKSLKENWAQTEAAKNEVVALAEKTSASCSVRCSLSLPHGGAVDHAGHSHCADKERIRKQIERIQTEIARREERQQQRMDEDPPNECLASATTGIAWLWLISGKDLLYHRIELPLTIRF